MALLDALPPPNAIQSYCFFLERMKYFVIKILKSLFVTVFLHFRPPLPQLAQTDGCDTAGGILTVKSMLKKNVQTAEMLK